jgi:hypothetical protein
VVDDDARVHRHAPVSSTMMGLMSISRSCGSAQTISDTRSSICSSASMSAGRRAAPFAQRLGHAAALDQPARQELVQRRQFHRAVGDQLDHRAAGAEGDHRAEGVVGGQADVDLAAALGPAIGWIGDAVDARAGLGRRTASSMSL